MPKCGRRNEHPEFEFLTHPKESDFILKNAPFGTTLTPSTRMKIVGGKAVYFVDSRLTDGEPSPRQIVKHVSAKPNHIDPWEVKRGQVGYSTADKDDWGSQFHPPLPNGNDLNPFKVIPPIQHENRHQQQHNNHIVPSNTTNHQQQHSNHIVPSNTNTYSNKNGFQQRNHYQRDMTENYPPLSEKERLLRLLPHNVYLPTEPLRLANDDRCRLLSLLNDELRELEAKRLEDIYLDLTSYDNQFTGFCYMQDLSYMLGRHRIFLSPDILRLVACQFVSGQQEGKVNYEKILGFFGAALKTSENSNQNPPERGFQHKHTLRMDNHYTYADSPRSEVLPTTPRSTRPNYYVSKQNKPQTPTNDSEVSKLVRLVEEQLYDSDEEIDFDRLTMDFRKMDPNHRGTMSAAQVKQIIYNPSHHIPLQESIVNQILSKCDHHGDGQYHWMQFIEFLEKVQPRQTGLILPKSKRPLEYAKDYGNPSTNWPHAESPKPNYSQPARKQEPSDDILRKTPLPTYARDYNGNVQNQQDGRVSQIDVDRKEQEIKDLEREYQRMKLRLSEEKDESEPRFQRFLKMASSIYGQDVDNSGFLPYDEVKKLIRLYNDTYNLRLAEHDIDKSIMENYTKGRVAIHPMLSQLGGK